MVEGCPVHSSSGDECPRPSSPSSDKYNELANDFVFDSSRGQNQVSRLSTAREVSGIKKGDVTPAHQPDGVENWVYPSEQQYFNAMKKKGYNPNEKDVPVILAIHNLVNEQGWTRIKEWELLRGNCEPKLRSFKGRPNDVSPKATFLNLLGYSLPFDRHDWVVDREGKSVRYIIDFYSGARSKYNDAAISIHLDVRPALDSPGALFDRVHRYIRETFFPASLPFSQLKYKKKT